MNILQDFKNKPFIEAVQSFFKQTLQITVNELGILPTNAFDVIGENVVNSIIQDNGVYIYGVVDYEFDKNQTLKNTDDVNNLKEDYAGILIIAVIVKNEIKQPSRTQLADITRAFHRKIAAMPIIVVFKYDGAIAIANTERIPFVDKNKTGEKVGKVSMLKDISIDNPHAAHLKILLELGQNKALSFNELYNHWQITLNTKELNKKFFKKIANWYFWSVAKSKFPYNYLKTDPKHKDKTDEKLQELANQKATIRFITRIIFVWFLKEKSLIPSNLFDKEYLKNIVKDFETTNSGNYYNAILQNLFFATLNRSSQFRQFADDKGYNVNKTTDYDQNSFFRYETMFQDENLENIMKLFAKIPFINGGLFDSLDIKPDKTNNIKEEIIDGFSRNKNWQATMPNYLFFESQNIDFDNELRIIYDTKKGNYEVKGLFAIFEEYKFTVEENTPLDVDVALDPYLLGEIFENLLAYYNPETGATARKGSGSFYTPQEIVNYMVSESLKAYLGDDLQDFENLAALNQNQKHQLVKKLANVKILDPACGSGAFPMGVLYKMVDILKTVDPDNSIWKQVQHDKIIGDKIKELENDKKAIANLSDDEVRTKATKAVEDRLQDLETNFNNQHHFDDYTRKLYIIRNSIYGVDIQDVAIQISKLRFFLSLIIDQKNENIKPLPNLETKFVIANTLISIDLPKFMVLGQEDHSQDQVKHLKEELKTIREKHFYVTDRKEKQTLKKQDAAKRLEIANALADSMTDYKQDDLDRLNQAIANHQTQLAQAELMPNMVQEMIVKDLFGKETTVKVNYRLERIKECNQAIKAAQNKIASLQTNTQAEIIRTQALKIADWDIYNQNAHANWFDTDWMFGLSSSNNNNEIVVLNKQIIAINAQIDAANVAFALGASSKLLHLKLASVATQCYILADEIENIRNRINELFGLIPKGLSNVVNEPYNIEYQINSLNIKINEINKELETIKLSLKAENDNGVFDIVIGNPPYKVVKTNEQKYYKNYKVVKTGELYSYFFENSIDRLLKNNGIISFITASIFIKGLKFLLLRDFLEMNIRLVSLEIMGDKIFDNVQMPTAILIGIKETNKLIKWNFNDFNNNLKISSKIEIDTIPLSNISSIMRGFEIGRDKVSYTGEIEFITGSCVNKWEVKQKKYITLDTLNNFNKEKKFFENERIFLRETGSILTAIYISNMLLCNRSLYSIIINDLNIITKYVTCILNSTLIQFYYVVKFKNDTDIFPKIRISQTKQLPIKQIPLPAQQPFIALVDKILAGKKAGDNTSNLEHQIDIMVYHLYKLTFTEAQVIDAGLSADDFEKYKMLNLNNG